MPMELRRLEQLVKKYGCKIKQNPKKQSHYVVLNARGESITRFAVTHGKGRKGGEVLDAYVSTVRRLIMEEKNQQENNEFETLSE